MSSIIIYDDPASEAPENRIEGMIAAGAEIRAKAPGVKNPNDAKNVVNGLVDGVIAAGAGKHANFEVTGEPPKKIVGKTGGNYDLDGSANKVQLKGAVDDKTGNVFGMVSVIPAEATINAWSYLTERVAPDTAKLFIDYAANPGDPAKKTRLENYLIATFTFTRCV